MANTDSSDINEIQLGYFLSNNWKNFDDPGAAQQQLETKKRKVGNDEYRAQTDRAKSFEVISRARQSAALADRETLMGIVAETDLFKEFLDNYRKAPAEETQ